jgi:hypothetical protein
LIAQRYIMAGTSRVCPGTDRRALAALLREHLAASGSLAIDTIGGSMHPAIPGGAEVDVVGLGDGPSPRDALVFVQPAGAYLCCHRVVAVRTDGSALTAADRTGRLDGWVAPELQVGLARRVRCGGGSYPCDGTGPPRYRRALQRMRRAGTRLAHLLTASLHPTATARACGQR